MVFYRGYAHYRDHISGAQKSLSEQLTTLGESKVNEILTWRSQFLIDGIRLQSSNDLLNNIGSLVSAPSDVTILAENLKWMKSLLSNPNYSSVYLLNRKGEPLLSVGDLGNWPTLPESIINNEGSPNDQIVMTDLFKAEDGSIYLDVIVPLINPYMGLSSIYSTVVMRIDPFVDLYPALQNWPSMYETAETLLVRKEGDKVLFLNQLRFRENTALALSLPLSTQDLPAAMAMNGTTGVVEGKDYQGTDVIAAILPVRDTNWTLIAKISADEIYGEITSEMWNLVLTLLSLTIAIGLSVNYLWRRQSSGYYKKLYQNEIERKNLEQKYTTLFDQANDAIILVEENGKIMDANIAALAMYGYSREELLELSIKDLRNTSAQHEITHDMDQVKSGKTSVFETEHIRKNGEIFVVDVSSRFLLVAGHGFFQSIIRDITDRKRSEEELRLSEARLKKAQEVSHVGSWTWHIETDDVEWSDELYKIYGIRKEAFTGKMQDLVYASTHPEDRPKTERLYALGKKLSRLFSFDYQIVRPDGSERIIRVEAGEIAKDAHGKTTMISGIVQDITEIKSAEKELRKRENLLSKIFDLLPVGLWISDKEGRLIQSNKMVKEIWGKDILVGVENFDVFHGRRLPSREVIQPDDWASVHTIREGVTIRDELVEIDAYDGATKTIMNYSTPFITENGEIEGAIVMNLDVTAQIKAEAQLRAQLEELRRWNLATLGRENRILDLKKEINDLLMKQRLPPKYPSVDGEFHE